MAGRYVLKVLLDFAASHQLHGYPGACARLHGHNWKVEVEVEARRLDPLGMGMDFKRIKALAREVVDGLDHRHLNELPPFRDRNPTAEHLAAHLHAELAPRLAGEHTRLLAVTVWETDRAGVRYTETDEEEPA
ncbi:MAG: 6-carboxytetrahydropterin synthase QueD [Gammaproteobacteria bacterium]|nr:MAG: 6-carboxytetrahydropterin synthase QueD [Gammaproteobacteria bacterium]